MTETAIFAPSRLRGENQGLTFGILCTGTRFQRWQAEAIRILREHGHRPVLLVTDARQPVRSSFFMRVLHKRLRTLLYTFLENRIFLPEAKELVELSGDLSGVPVHSVLVEKRGFSEYFREEDLEQIRSRKPDFLLRFGFGIVRGGILSAARYGVWSFHHDDEMKYRGGPAGFWEIYRCDPVNGAILQRLTDRLDAGIILRKGYLKTISHSYRGNLQQLLMSTASWPALAADALCRKDGEEQPEEPVESDTKAPVFRLPGNLQMLWFLLRLLQNRIRFWYYNYLAAEQWHTGIIRRDIADVALGAKGIAAGEIEWLPLRPRNGYLADPAGFEEAGRLRIMAEVFSYRTGKATITGLTTGSQDGLCGFTDLQQQDGILQGGSHHMSYPYILRHGGIIYCIPECHQSGAVTLYRQEKGTGRFLPVRDLLTGIPAIDPTLVWYEDRWWLFLTERACSNSHLFLYHAPSLESSFYPHPENPVRIDVRSARPAGTPFLHDGILYRPAQDCSRTYGGRIALNRVIKMTTGHFREETVRYLEPARGSGYARGLHTLSGAGMYTLIDGKRYCFDRFYTAGQLAGKLFGERRQDG